MGDTKENHWKCNKRKSDFLGMSFGTATHRLRKMILFDLLKKYDLNKCYLCGKLIDTVRDLSVEHKRKWLGVDVNLFWDMDNIAFAHLSCNSMQNRKEQKGPISHGTHSGYSYRDCRCSACNEAHNEYQREWREKDRNEHI
jgi:hypothetical protein